MRSMPDVEIRQTRGGQMTTGRARSTPVDGMLRIVCVVPFLDESGHLPVFLRSMAGQHRFPDVLVLVDDGSSDDSPRIAAEFADARDDVVLLRRARRARARDRLARAAELEAFHHGLQAIASPWDVAAKMDADLELPPDLFAVLEQTFLGEPELGIAGAHLSIVDEDTGGAVRERCPPAHVRGATKFYRRACFRDISPIAPILGWDTIDEVAARKHGWQTRSVACPAGDVIHQRPTGASDGMLRAQYRWGACAYGIGQHPLWVALSALRRSLERPRLAGAIAFLVGWLTAAARRRPRAEASTRAFVRREQLSSLRSYLGA